MDGRRVSGFDYEAGRLSHTSRTLDYGRHEVEVSVRDAEGARFAESWGFRVTRRR